MLTLFYTQRVKAPAFAMLGYWMLVQVLDGISLLSPIGSDVAFWAHISGFIDGSILIF